MMKRSETQHFFTTFKFILFLKSHLIIFSKQNIIDVTLLKIILFKTVTALNNLQMVLNLLSDILRSRFDIWFCRIS